jgi:hypothetical protein
MLGFRGQTGRQKLYPGMIRSSFSEDQCGRSSFCQPHTPTPVRVFPGVACGSHLLKRSEQFRFGSSTCWHQCAKRLVHSGSFV